MYINVRIDQLARWPGNPRPPASAETKTTLKASIAHKGVLVPMIVRPLSEAEDQYEVIGGDTRRGIGAELVAEGVWQPDQLVPVHVRADLVGDDAAALDVAMSENLHIPVHPMDQFSAFKQLVDLGRAVTEIANSYGVTTRIVEQRLSYAKLTQEARDIVRKGERDLDWASAMTIATLEEQAGIMEKIEKTPGTFLSGADIRRFLDNDLVPTQFALFSVDAVADELVRKDLFDAEGQTYLPRGVFDDMQKKALDALIEERKSEGWASVTVLNVRQFNSFDYDDGSEDKSVSGVVFVTHDSGQVVEYTGLKSKNAKLINSADSEADLDAGEALFDDIDDDDSNSPFGAGASLDEASDDESSIEQVVSPQVIGAGKNTKAYLASSRALICQGALMDDPRLMIAVTVAGMLQMAAPKILQGKVFSDMEKIDPDMPARAIVENRLETARQIMRDNGLRVESNFEDLVDQLLKLNDVQLMTLLQIHIASRVTTDLGHIEKLLASASRQGDFRLSTYWRPDRKYLGTLTVPELKALGLKILPERLHDQLTGSKGDLVEVIAQIVEDVYADGMRLQHAEKEVLMSWAPDMLVGDASQPASHPFVANDDDAENSGDAQIFA